MNLTVVNYLTPKKAELICGERVLVSGLTTFVAPDQRLDMDLGFPFVILGEHCFRYLCNCKIVTCLANRSRQEDSALELLRKRFTSGDTSEKEFTGQKADLSIR